MAKGAFTGPLEQVDACCYRIPKSYKPGMRVDGLIFANETLLKQLLNDQAPEQVANVAFLPGIQHASLAMPDIHWGYGFCIGGVCATDPDEGGVISPGGVGYDINCGVRLARTNLFYREVKPHLQKLVDGLFKNVPTGVGRSGRFTFKGKDLTRLLGEGSSYLTTRELATTTDIEHTEAGGWLAGADPDEVSDHAKLRGQEQCGTLGSGNHFLEVQVVDAIFDDEAAQVMGLEKDMICVMIHSGCAAWATRSATTPCTCSARRRKSTASSCPTASSRARRSTARKARSTSPPCARPPTSRGATVSSSCGKRAKCSRKSLADRGRNCR